MSKAHLRPCPACARHVRVSETGCPFCGGALADSFRADPRPQAPRARLARAALLALGTGSVALVACSSTAPTPAYGGSPVELPVDAGEDAGDKADAQPAQDAAAEAAPRVDGGEVVDGGDLDAPTTEPPYGSPPRDAEPDHGGFYALYGGPPI
jgi:hypothetical protein